MDNDTQNAIKEQFSSLPLEIQQAVASFNWAAKLAEVGAKNALHVDQIGILENEVLAVLLGAVSPDDFAGQLKARIGLPDDKATALINDCNALIFQPIRAKILENYNQELEDVEIPATEEETLKSAGVEVLDGKLPTPAMPEIKAPVKAGQAPSMAEAKMMGAFSLPKKESDLSISKPADNTKKIEQAPLAPKIDPYKEKI